MKRSKSPLLISVLLIILSFSLCTNKKVTNLGIFAQSRISNIVGQDGCTPIPINNNIMLWTFGDTILGEWKKKVNTGSTFEDTAVMKNMLSNSLAYSIVPDDENIHNLKFNFYKEKNSVAPFLKKSNSEKKNNIRLWAIDGIKLQNSVFVYYMIIQINKNSSEIFSMNGIGLARWDLPQILKSQPDFKFKRLGILFDNKHPTFGDCVIEKDKFLYLIGHKKNKKDNKVSAYIARVEKQEIQKHSKYEFLISNGEWTKDINHATGFFQDVMGELSLSYNVHLNKYVVIYCSLSSEIRIVLFSSFKDLINSNPKVLYTPPKLKEIESRPFLFYYSGKEIFYTKEAIYAIYIHPAIYQPILLKIPYGVLE